VNGWMGEWVDEWMGEDRESREKEVGSRKEGGVLSFEFQVGSFDYRVVSVV